MSTTSSRRIYCCEVVGCSLHVKTKWACQREVFETFENFKQEREVNDTDVDNSTPYRRVCRMDALYESRGGREIVFKGFMF